MRTTVVEDNGIICYKLSSDSAYLVILFQLLVLGYTLVRVVVERYFVYLAVPVIFFIILRPEVSERVLIIRGLGIQTEKRGRIRLFQDQSSFYPKNSMNAVVINEVFEGFRINYVLQMILKDQQELGLVFSSFRPKLKLLQDVWLHINSV